MPRRRTLVTLGMASLAAGAWMGRIHAERVLLPLVPLHGRCLDTIGGWADLARGDLPDPECPTGSGSCELSLMLADSADSPLPSRIIARRHAIEAGCPPQRLMLDDLTLSPQERRHVASKEQDPWTAEPIALHGLWGDALLERARLGDPDALDLTADLVKLDRGSWPAARAILAEPVASGDATGQAEVTELARALIELAGRPERGPDLHAYADVLEHITGSGDATHALLVEADVVRAWIARGVDPLDRLETALFSPTSAGSSPGDVHAAFVAGGGAPGATALAAALVRDDVIVTWDGQATRVRVAEREWWLDGCSPVRRTRPSDPVGTAVSPVALALAERVGAWLRAGDLERAQAAEAELSLAVTPQLIPRLFSDAVVAPTPTPPWRVPVRRGRARAAPTLEVLATPPLHRRALADMLVFDRSADDLALAAWAAWQAGDEELARLLLRDPPASAWHRFAWRTVAVALGEPSEAPQRPSGCAPALWPGPM